MPEGPEHLAGKQLILRSRILNLVRTFFFGNDYIEVETPNRIPAPAPELHIEAQPSDQWFLHTSPELCMKRLLAAGWPRIFQICRCYRRDERGRRHLPEFTLLEWYTAQADYQAMMRQCEDLMLHVNEGLGQNQRLSFQGTTIDLSPPWPRMTVSQAFADFADISVKQALADDRFDEIMGIEIEPRLGVKKPVFLMDYPTELAALARPAQSHPGFAERFELYMGGLELCNAFSELTDAVEQRRRFEDERRKRAQAGKQTYPLPEKFLAELGCMPPAAGNALGLDRLVMLLADTDRIDDVVAFVPEDL